MLFYIVGGSTLSHVVLVFVYMEWKEARTRRKADEYYERMFGRWGA